MARVRTDIHPHLISPDTEKYPITPLGGIRSTWSEDSHSLTAEQLIEAMDEAGIAKSAIVHSSTTYGFNCNLVADAVAAHPDRFTGVCSVDVLAPDAVDKLKHWTSLGITGLRLFTTGTTMPGQADWLNDPKTYPSWEWCGENGIPICLQINPAGIGMARDMMDRFPKVKIILDHAGRPDLSEGAPYPSSKAIFELADYKQLSVKTTPAVLLYARKGNATPETFLSMLVDAFGADRIAWGSNYPASPGKLIDLQKESEDAYGAFLSEADLNKIMGETALGLYPALAK